jgi:hypothetical protein
MTEAIPLLVEASTRKPEDTFLAMRLSLGMAEYRNGHFPAANEALVAAAQAASTSPGKTAPANIEGSHLSAILGISQ